MIYYLETHKVCPQTGKVILCDHFPRAGEGKLLGHYCFKYNQFTMCLPDGKEVFRYTTQQDNYFISNVEQNHCFQQGTIKLLEHYPEVEV